MKKILSLILLALLLSCASTPPPPPSATPLPGGTQSEEKKGGGYMQTVKQGASIVAFSAIMIAPAIFLSVATAAGMTAGGIAAAVAGGAMQQ